MPAASAMRTASAVGAETDTITGAPIAAAFCTNLMHRYPTTGESTMPALATMDARARVPESLSSALVAANVLAARR